MAQYLEQYLERYAEPEWRLSRQLSRAYDQVLVVPIRRESAQLLRGYRAAIAAAGGATLVILVVNGSADAADCFEPNAELLGQLTRDCLSCSLGDPDNPDNPANPAKSANPVSSANQVRPASRASLGRDGDADVLIIDRNTTPLPPKSGAGLARKIGSDVALGLYAGGLLRSRWIAQTDADVTLPADYFQRLHAAGSAGADGSRTHAVVFPFRHVAAEKTHENSETQKDDKPSEDRVFQATLRYEVLLRYHRLGMASAGQQYGWHSLGSCLAVSCDGYAATRGFPKRLAGEDFYMLCKLSKLSHGQNILSLGGAPIRIASRLSNRAPFGTGPSVARLLNHSLTLTDWRCFQSLSRLIRGLDRVVEEQHVGALELAYDGDRSDYRLSIQALQSLKGMVAIEAILARTRQAADTRLALHTWFDGLKRLRFCHALRDAAYPDLPWQRALADAPFLHGTCSAIPDATDRADWQSLREHLAQLEAPLDTLVTAAGARTL